jgi:hypothetical protein
MLMAGRVLVSGWLLIVVIGLAAAPAAAQDAAAAVTISVPVAQVLEGPSRISLLPGTTLRETLIVKSNVPWTLVARTGASSGAISWGRSGSSGWQLLSPLSILAHGDKGTHTVDVHLRRADAVPGPSVIVTFAVEMSPR